MAIAFVVRKWRHYLPHVPFTICTDQQEGSPITRAQTKMCYNFDIQHNAATHALSRAPTLAELHTLTCSEAAFFSLDSIREEILPDPRTSRIIQHIAAGRDNPPHFSLIHDTREVCGQIGHYKQIEFQGSHFEGLT